MPTVLLEVSAGVARITLNRPDKLNAIDASMLDQLEHVLDHAEQNEDVRAILLRGQGRAFSAGFDLDSPAFDNGDAAEIARELRRDFDVIMRFWECRKPTIAAVHGYCLGSSMEISAVCDLTIAADDCLFGAPEVKFGSGIVCLVLPWIVGLKNAKEILLTGDNFDAQRAATIGLVNRTVAPEQLQQEAEALAQQIAANDALAVQLTKGAINRSIEHAGFRKALIEALDCDIRIETTATPESLAFKEVMDRDGLKAALAWRAAQLQK